MENKEIKEGEDQTSPSDNVVDEELFQQVVQALAGYTDEFYLQLIEVLEGDDDTPPEKIDLELRVSDDKSYTANRPRMKLLKKVIRLNEAGAADPEHFSTEEGINELFQLIIDIFDNEELTVEVLEEVYMEDILSLENINGWINQYFPKKRITEVTQIQKMRSKQKARKNI